MGLPAHVDGQSPSVLEPRTDPADIQPMLEYFLGFTMGQQSATRAASLARSAAVADGTHHTNRIEDLNERVDKLLMIVRAMWALMEEQGMTPEQLMAKIDELDLQDGVDDDQVRSQIVECPSCQSKVAPNLRACQLCGTEAVCVGLSLRRRPDGGYGSRGARVERADPRLGRSVRSLAWMVGPRSHQLLTGG